MPSVTESARAKINLTLTVLGRRSDSYHELLSLVAFADAADIVVLDPEGVPGITVTGPFAGAIEGINLVQTALHLVHESCPGLKVGHVTLEKNLPVAAGIGGGSSDAAAVLRAVPIAYSAETAHIDGPALARRLGADVPVCFADRAAWMSGTGERLDELEAPLPRLDAVLVNPMASVPADKTARVFRALAAAEVKSSQGNASALPAIPDRSELLALIKRIGNDLEAPASAVIPEIQTVLEALEACPGAFVSQLSGAGPTCFAIFESATAARSAADALKSAHPGCWIIPATIG